MDGLGLDGYSYGYAGYSCGYASGRYWPGQGYEGAAQPPSRRGEPIFSRHDPLVSMVGVGG